MVGCSRSGFPKWITAATRVEFDGASSTNASKSEAQSTSSPPSPSAAHLGSSLPDTQMGFGERALSAAGAAVISAILVNPLDVAKVRSCFFFFLFGRTLTQLFVPCFFQCFWLRESILAYLLMIFHSVHFSFRCFQLSFWWNQNWLFSSDYCLDFQKPSYIVNADKVAGASSWSCILSRAASVRKTHGVPRPNNGTVLPALIYYYLSVSVCF